MKALAAVGTCDAISCHGYSPEYIYIYAYIQSTSYY